MYEVTQGRWRTPRGNSVEVLYRTDTSDWNTIQSAVTEDEYRLAELHLSGYALDIGAHIGGVTLALLADNPELRVIAVEAVPPNVVLLRENLSLNGFEGRCTVIHASAGTSETVRWAFEGDETAAHHAFIGNSLLPGDTKHQTFTADTASLAEIIGDAEIAFAKVDCEGCEYELLRGPALRQIALIRGELHGVPGDNDPAEVAAALLPTHTFTRGEGLPCAFEAVRK